VAYARLSGWWAQDDRPEGLAETAEDLVQQAVLSHKDRLVHISRHSADCSSPLTPPLSRDVKLLTSCCLVDVLRVYAPEAPYTPEQLKRVFSLITQQLRGLCACYSIATDLWGPAEMSPPLPSAANEISADDSRSRRIHYILESLANVKSCVILTELAQQGVVGGDEGLVDFFDCLLDGLNDDHPQSVVDAVLEALSACLDELDYLTQPLVDTLLMGLLPITRKENARVSLYGSMAWIHALIPPPQSVAPQKYQVSVALLRRCFNRVCQPISQFINGVLSGSGQGLGGVESELKEHVLHLIYELHKVNSGFLLYVLPNVAVQLQSEDVASRGGAMSLLGRLFASTHADYGENYPKNWSDFLRRFRDVEAGVRGKMIEYGAAILQRKPALRKDLWEAIGLRLSDPEWEVRRKAVHELCDLAVHSIDAVSANLMKLVGDRLKDRKPQIRKDAATGLAQIYAKHMSKTWVREGEPEGGGSDQQKCIEIEWPDSDAASAESLAAKLSWIPEHVIKCYAYPELEMRSRVLQLLDDVLLPKLGSTAVRAAGLLFIWQGLDEPAKAGLNRILKDRQTRQKAVQRYLSVRKLQQASRNDESLRQQLDQSFADILNLVPVSDRKANPLQRLHSINDKRVFAQLGVICDPCSPFDAIANAREDLFKRVGSKTMLGEYLRVLTRHACLLSTPPDALEYLIDVATLEMGDDASQGSVALEILGLCSELFPTQLANHRAQKKLWSALSSADKVGDEQSKATVLRVMARATSAADAGKGPASQSSEDSDSDGGHFSSVSGAIRAAVVSADTPDLAEAAVMAAKTVLSQSAAAEVAKAAIHELAGRRGVLLSGSSRKHAQALRSLGFVAENFPAVFGKASEAKVALQFARDVITERRAGAGGADDACAALELLSRRLVPLPLESSANQDAMAKDLREESSQLLETLFGILDRGGGLTPAGATDPPSAAKLRGAAAVSALRLMTNGHIQGLLSTEQWHKLGFVLLDSDESVRTAFGTALRSMVGQGLVHMKFASYLCLEAGRPTAAESRAALVSAVQVLRSAHARKSERSSSPKEMEQLTHLLPEYILPYAIHLLSHHPMFEEGLSDRALERDMALLLSALLTHGNRPSTSDNLSFLLQMGEIIVSNYCDAVEGSDPQHLIRVADAACDVLRAEIKSQDSLQPFPGTVYLPKQLYRKRLASDPVPAVPQKSKKRAPATNWAAPDTAHKAARRSGGRSERRIPHKGRGKGRGAPIQTVDDGEDKSDGSSASEDGSGEGADWEMAYAGAMEKENSSESRGARAAARAAARSRMMQGEPKSGAPKRKQKAAAEDEEEDEDEEDEALAAVGRRRARTIGLR
jgi:sister-chromatid-cohesion protein PDS5